MKEIAVIGFGVVGGGVVSLVDKNQKYISEAVGEKVRVKYILDLRDFPDSPYADRVIHTPEPLFEDPDISLVVETMGGVNPAYDYTKRALSAGKHVVTSNKELVATHGTELTALAAAKGAAYLYEASVGGGIPLIRPMRTSLRGEKIDAVHGILNGTTNYILTKMRTENQNFADALADAQRLGYAERNPAADVDGIDAQRKIMILTAVATGYLPKAEEVYTETMTKITVADMDGAKRAGYAIKLIGLMERIGENVTVSVCPRLVAAENPLASVNDVYNAIQAVGSETGDVMFYGRGAGRFPTAGAVVSDIVAALDGAYKHERNAVWQPAPEGFVKHFGITKSRWYVRVKAGTPLPCERTLIEGSPADVYECITEPMTEGTAYGVFEPLGEYLLSAIRVMD